MKTIFELLQETGYKYYRQGSAPGDNCPDSFFTEWQVEGLGNLYYDNDNKAIDNLYSICFYTKDPVLLNEINKFIENAKKSGYIISKYPEDIASGNPEYFGRMTKIINMI